MLIEQITQCCAELTRVMNSSAWFVSFGFHCAHVIRFKHEFILLTVSCMKLYVRHCKRLYSMGGVLTPLPPS